MKRTTGKAKSPPQLESGSGMVVAIQPAERKLTAKARTGDLVQFSVGPATVLTRGRKQARIA